MYLYLNAFKADPSTMSSRLGIFKHIATAVAFQKSLKTVKVVNKFNKTPKRANAVIWRQNK